MSKKGKAKTHQDLDGLELEISSLGEIKSNVPIDKINEFLNEKVADKKLENRKNVED